MWTSCAAPGCQCTAGGIDAYRSSQAERRGMFCLAAEGKQPFSPAGGVGGGAALTLVTLYARLCVCRLPSWWSTTNRSIDKRPTGQLTRWRATGSFAHLIAVNTSSAPLFVKAGWRVPNDRFLVLQHEGVWHAPFRPHKLPRELALRGLPAKGGLMAFSDPSKSASSPRPHCILSYF